MENVFWNRMFYGRNQPAPLCLGAITFTEDTSNFEGDKKNEAPCALLQRAAEPEISPMFSNTKLFLLYN